MPGLLAEQINAKLLALSKLIDINKWRGVFHGMFHYSIVEREKYWTYEDDIDFEIACYIKNIISKGINGS